MIATDFSRASREAIPMTEADFVSPLFRPYLLVDVLRFLANGSYT